MANLLLDFYRQRGWPYLAASLQAIVGRSPAFVQQERLYRLHVIEPGWIAVSAAVGLSRTESRWDELLLALRQEVYCNQAGQLVLRTDSSSRLLAVLSRLLAVGEAPGLPPQFPGPNPQPQPARRGRDHSTRSNVLAHGLGILVVEPGSNRRSIHPLIPKNTPLPVTITRVFRTFRPNQQSVTIRVVAGDCEQPDTCEPVGTCEIRDLPPDLPAGWPVRICYSYSADGEWFIAAKLEGHSAVVSTSFIREPLPGAKVSNLLARPIAGES